MDKTSERIWLGNGLGGSIGRFLQEEKELQVNYDSSPPGFLGPQALVLDVSDSALAIGNKAGCQRKRNNSYLLNCQNPIIAIKEIGNCLCL